MTKEALKKARDKYEEKQKALGRKLAAFRITEEEKQAIIELLKKMRGE